MTVWVVISLYEGLVQEVEVEVYDSLEKARIALSDMEADGLKVSGPHEVEVH